MRLPNVFRTEEFVVVQFGENDSYQGIASQAAEKVGGESSLG